MPTEEETIQPPETSPPENPLKKRREEKQVRQLFKNKCWKEIRGKWTNVREDCNLHWNGPDAEDCQMEKSVIREHTEVFEHGVVMTLVVFGTLRLIAHPRFEPFSERLRSMTRSFFSLTPPKSIARSKSNSKRFDQSKSKKKNPSQQETANYYNSSKSPKLAQQKGQQQFGRPRTYLEKQRDERVEAIHRVVDPYQDFMLAAICGVSSIFFFSRPRQLRLDCEEAPLTPGRSFVSENLCDGFIKIMQETDPKIFVLKEDESVDANLKSFQQFALHCVLRTEYVQKRKEAGKAKPFVLPISGPWE